MCVCVCVCVCVCGCVCVCACVGLGFRPYLLLLITNDKYWVIRQCFMINVIQEQNTWHMNCVVVDESVKNMELEVSLHLAVISWRPSWPDPHRTLSSLSPFWIRLPASWPPAHVPDRTLSLPSPFWIVCLYIGLSTRVLNPVTLFHCVRVVRLSPAHITTHPLHKSTTKARHGRTSWPVPLGEFRWNTLQFSTIILHLYVTVIGLYVFLISQNKTKKPD